MIRLSSLSGAAVSESDPTHLLHIICLMIGCVLWSAGLAVWASWALCLAGCVGWMAVWAGWLAGLTGLVGFLPCWLVWLVWLAGLLGWLAG